ncbi:MAG: hypothetical protein KME08_21025 [Aphanothece sp. CMT-3BRIN-NPC111]|nr:hypothetical protein [Aphanothece sp. CMT-3BRIN-NPC111]
MVRQIRVESYLSVEELETKYRQVQNVISRTYYEIIWVLVQHKSPKEVAAI